MSLITVEKAINSSVVDQIKTIADSHRTELGFHSRQTFLDSLKREEILIAKIDNNLAGFVRYYHRRDGQTTLYEIATIREKRSKGVGRRLIDALIADCQRVGSRYIRLSCPVELPANRFYEAMSFIHSARRSRRGKSRPLYEWELPVLPHRPITFVASLTASGYDLGRLIRMWETEGPDKKPFEKCIITPLFIDPGALDYVRYMHNKWGIGVIFDSGGFFVQQEKIAYDELFARLLDFYLRHRWAEAYVLPDFVPTSKQSSDEVTERVYVTATEGVKFLRRLPTDLRDRALGVLQGHTPEHLKHCFEAFLSAGLQRIGFGSFDTGGVKAEINILTDSAARRLGFVRDFIQQAFIAKAHNI